MKFRISIVLCAILAFSCQNQLEEIENGANDHKSAMVFGDTTFNFPEFSRLVQDQAESWDVLGDFLNEAKGLNGSNFQVLKNRSERLTEFSDSLFNNIPSTLDNNQIRSRLRVLKTRAEILYQNTHQGIQDSASLQQSVVEMNSAVSNLILQMNEKFQKDEIDSQRKENEQMELRDRQRLSDSILELERQDARERGM